MNMGSTNYNWVFFLIFGLSIVALVGIPYLYAKMMKDEEESD
jgi:hypothetical protein